MSCETSKPVFIGSDHLVQVWGLYDEIDDTYENSATITAQLFESNRTTNVGGSVTLNYVAASSGDYEGSIAGSVTSGLTKDTTYYIKVVISSSSIDDVRWLRRTAKLRGST